MNHPLDAATIKANTDIVEVVRKYVPDLKQRGSAWLASCPFHNGDSTPSFTVHPAGTAGAGEAGYFKCFGCSLGGDVISFVEAIEHTDFAGALKILSNGHANGNGAAPKRKLADVLKQQPPPDLNLPAPEGAPACNFIHPKRGKAVKAWAYLTADRQLLGYDARYEDKKGKAVLPWRFIDGRWQLTGFADPKPLYGLEDLAAKPDKPVLVVEGAKCVEAARVLFQGVFPVVSWQGGADGVGHADWSALYGRTVILWPDADVVGLKAMLVVGNKLFAACPKVTIIEPNAKLLLCPDCVGGETETVCPYCGGAGTVENTEFLPDHWDVADAVDEGWDVKRWREWAKQRVRDIKEVVPEKAIEKAAEEKKQRVEKLEAKEAAGTARPYQRLWVEWNLDPNGKSGEPIPNLNNVALILEKDERFKDFVYYDEFYQKIMLTHEKREWADIDDIHLTLDLQRRLGISRISRDTVLQAVIDRAYHFKRHAVRDWLETLEWDGVPRIGSFFEDSFGGERDAYHIAAATNFFIAMVARAYVPGCKVDNMLILEGAQGIRKSTALSALVGKEWFAEQHESVTNPKAFAEIFRGKWLIEISEFESFRNADASKIKQAVTCQSDRYRVPFEKHASDHPRTHVMVATANTGDYLRDPTGARRFWPIKCVGRIDIENILARREQFFAEAVSLYKSGATWWEVPEAEAEAAQRARYQEEVWGPAMLEYLEFDGNTRRITPLTQLVTGDMLRHLNIPQERWDTQQHRRVSAWLAFQGFERIREGKGWIFVRKEEYES